MKNLAIIPARSGSKGLKDKNIRLLNGKPLLVYSFEAAQKSNVFDEIMVSTDSEEYAEIAKSYGAKVPFLRSPVLSSDHASSWDVVKDILNWYKDNGKEFQTVTLLQPTSPLRDANNIRESYDLFSKKKAKSVVSLCEMDHSPLWANVLPEDISLKNFLNKDLLNSQRQKLPVYYRINGAIYMVDVEHLINDFDLYGEDSYAYLMKKENSVDIDDEFDFKLAEMLIKERS
jgi:CMP-N,N'-diacetyllegionaminic acid synthase